MEFKSFKELTADSEKFARGKLSKLGSGEDAGQLVRGARMVMRSQGGGPAASAQELERRCKALFRAVDTVNLLQTLHKREWAVLAKVGHACGAVGGRHAQWHITITKRFIEQTQLKCFLLLPETA